MPRKTEEELLEHVNEVMQRLYREASPGMDFKEKLEEGPRDDEIPRYKLHYLDATAQVRIMKDYIDSLRLDKKDRRRVINGLHLGSSPCTELETVNNTRQELGLETVKPNE